MRSQKISIEQRFDLSLNPCLTHNINHSNQHLQEKGTQTDVQKKNSCPLVIDKYAPEMHMNRLQQLSYHHMTGGYLHL